MYILSRSSKKTSDQKYVVSYTKYVFKITKCFIKATSPNRLNKKNRMCYKYKIVAIVFESTSFKLFYIAPISYVKKRV